MTTLGEVADLVYGCPFPSGSFRDGSDPDGLPVVRIRDVVPGFSNTSYVGPYEPAYLVSTGDMLIGMDGEFNLARWRGGRALLNQRVCMVVPRHKALDGGYLYWFLPQQLKAIEARTPFVTVKHLSAKVLSAIEVPLPPLPEQRRIADILDRAAAVRRKRKEAIALTEELLRSAFLEMFGDPVTNPKGWSRKKVGELLLQTRSGATVRPENFRHAGFSVLHKGGIKPCGRVALDPAKSTCVDDEFARNNEPSIVDRSFVVVTLRDLVPTGPSIGLASSLEFAEHDQYLLVERVYGIVLDRKQILPEYFVWLSNNSSFRRVLAGMSVGATQIHIRRADYNGMSIPVPPIGVQMAFRRIVLQAARIDGRLALAAALNETLSASLLQGAFRGELGARGAKVQERQLVEVADRPQINMGTKVLAAAP